MGERIPLPTEDRQTDGKIAIVLVRTQVAENAGFVARAMKAFGRTDLRLAIPQFCFKDDSPAFKTASGAHDILRNARVFSSLREALADCRASVAFTRRPRNLFMPEYTLPELGERKWLHSFSGTLAFVFGPEDFGLSHEDIVLCDAVARIPMAVDTLSLNLAQAVTAALYELGRVPMKASADITLEGLTLDDRERLLESAIALLETTNYFKPGRKSRQIEALRVMLGKAELTLEEYHAAQGALNALMRELKNR